MALELRVHGPGEVVHAERWPTLAGCSWMALEGQASEGIGVKRAHGCKEGKTHVCGWLFPRPCTAREWLTPCARVWRPPPTAHLSF